MLSYISQKFSKPTRSLTHEPRAALFLNRFSRTLTIIYATNGLADLLGLPASELIGKSFYYCIQENCLREAVKCLESAKANDSIAYLRFWFRDPRRDERMDQDEQMSDGHSSGDEDDTGGVHLDELMDHDQNENAILSDSSNSMRSSVEPNQHTQSGSYSSFDPNSRTASGNSTEMGGNSSEEIFDRADGNQSRTSSISSPAASQSSGRTWSISASQVELEAVVSCTSDGLVLILRRAKTVIPGVTQPSPEAVQQPYRNGLFASPWANEPILPTISQPQQNMPNIQQSSGTALHSGVVQGGGTAMKGPAADDFMNSIREVAVFAWSLTGINGSLNQYARGTPTGESIPPGGLPIWDPNSNAGPETSRPNIAGYLTEEQHFDKGIADHGRYGHTTPMNGNGPAGSNYDLSGVPKALHDGRYGYNGYAANNGYSDGGVTMSNGSPQKP
ncbi:hypothetical protein MMC21_005628 [Puttea exsequens]|nr:hypothetical protein [Puttea exsequens]